MALQGSGVRPRPVRWTVGHTGRVSVGPDETEKLLEKLEAELWEKQARVDARVAREQARLDALTAEQEALEHRRVVAEGELARVIPRRDTMVKRRDQMRLDGSRGRPFRAALWSVFTSALTLGAVVPLASAHGGMPLLLLIGGDAVALLAGWSLVDLWHWRSR